MRTKTADMKTYRREYMQRWREANPDLVRKHNKASNEKHKDARAERRARPERRAKARAWTATYRARLGVNGRRNIRLKHMYGITLADFNTMVEKQKGLCPICRVSLTLARAHVDHDHATGKVRAVLCGCCNQAIGMLRETPRAAIRLAAYLRKHGK